MNIKRGQIGTEYLIVISFVVLAALTTMGIAVVYASSIQDSIRLNQLDKAAKKLIFSAETTFYDGEDALSTVEVFFPEGILDFQVYSNEIVFNISTRSGMNVIGYGSNVPLSDTGIDHTPLGLRKVQFLATTNAAEISFP